MVFIELFDSMIGHYCSKNALRQLHDNRTTAARALHEIVFSFGPICDTSLPAENGMNDNDGKHDVVCLALMLVYNLNDALLRLVARLQLPASRPRAPWAAAWRTS